MTIDFNVKPNLTKDFDLISLTIKINTQKGADAYNAFFDSDKKKGDMLTISKSAYDKFKMMRENSNLTYVFV